MKKFNILLANNTLSLLAGTETWTSTLAIQLKKLGHKVSCFSPELGIISEQLDKEGIPSFYQISTSGVKPFSFILEEKTEHNYDVIIANHHHIVEYLRNEFPRTPIISTIHGIMHWAEDEAGKKIMAPEHPALNSGVNQFIAVSEEVQILLKKAYEIDSIIIRNFFDLDSLKGLRKISVTPKQFLVNSNYNDKNSPDLQLIREVAKHYGAKLTAVGQNFSWTVDIRKALADADVVVGMGRSVLEGVAAGRLGIVNGRWGTAGVVRENNIEKLRRSNFSGRVENERMDLMTPEELIAEIDEFYNPETIKWGVDYMKREHNAVTAAESFVRIAEDLTGRSIQRPEEVQMKPYRRAKDVKNV